MNETLIARAKKIYALATRGIDGEKENAQRMLDLFLAKYGITLEEISEDTKKNRFFTANSKDKKLLLVHTLLIVCKGSLYRSWKNFHYSSDLTDYEFIQVSEMYEFHRKNFKSEFEKFQESFIQAYYHEHGLFDFEPDPDMKPSKNKTDEVDFELICKMADKMKKKFVKAIE